MTDREQVILKAIEHAGRGGLAEVSKVIRAVGYPKATTKKVLIDLAGQGIVTLHRHDYPGSLAPAERKFLVHWKGGYYNAVSARKTNPKGQHLPGLPKKAQREYEHVLKSELAMGRPIKRAKGIAAGKVRKDYGRNPRKIADPTLVERYTIGKAVVSIRSTPDGKYTASWTIKGVPGYETGISPSGLNQYKRRKFDSIAEAKAAVGQYNRNPSKRKKNTTVIKAKRVLIKRVCNPRKRKAPAGKIIKARVKKAAKTRRRNRDYPYWNIYHVDTKKSAPYDKTFLGSSSFGMSKAEAIEKFRRSHYPGRLRAGTKIIAEKGVITKNPKRKRNLDYRDSTHQVKVHQHWRAGGLSQWQRAHHAGQHDLFAHGIKAKPKRNPSAGDSAKWEKLWRAYIKALADLDKPSKGAQSRLKWARLAKAEKAIQKFDPDAYQRYVVGRKNPKRNAARSGHSKPLSKKRAGASRKNSKASKARSSVAKRNPGAVKKLVSKAVKTVKRVIKRNPTRKGMRKGYAQAKRISKITRGRYFSSESGQRQAARHEKRHERKAKRNPSAPEIRKTFAGRYSKDERLIFPDGTPQGLAKLGRLVSIKTEQGKIAPVKGTAWLCSDTRGKLHIGTPTKGHVVFGGPAHDYGRVREIEYMESKPHLGYKNQTLFFHKLGEETGVKPRLVTDGKGGAKFVGGAYQIRREGIIN